MQSRSAQIGVPLQLWPYQSASAIRKQSCRRTCASHFYGSIGAARLFGDYETNWRRVRHAHHRPVAASHSLVMQVTDDSKARVPYCPPNHRAPRKGDKKGSLCHFNERPDRNRAKMIRAFPLSYRWWIGFVLFEGTKVMAFTEPTR